MGAKEIGRIDVGRKHAGLRERMQRFARLRSANRALPAAASDMPGTEKREALASQLRTKLSELGSLDTPSPNGTNAALDGAMAELDAKLGTMESDLLERFDELPFVSLRASIPRSVETHGREVVSLLEVLLSARAELVDRLPKVEYLITMLSTEEVDGRRNIINDPVSLTPLLENFSVDGFDAVEGESIAMELYQAATLDSDAENFHEVLRSLRARKNGVGLGCLCPTVLRAVITYNARMFNSVESLAEASRASDSDLEAALAEASTEPTEIDGLDFEESTSALDGAEAAPRLQAVPEPKAAVADEQIEAQEPPEPVSVFDSEALQEVIEALRTRLDGGQIGRRGSAERVAIVLDMSALESIECAAIRAESPNLEEKIVARTTIVGLILRDVGPVRGELEKIGIDHVQLSDAWVRELNEAFGQLISEKLGDAKAYELTSKLSGIKSKHLMKPFNALKAGKRGGDSGRIDTSATAVEMRKIARSAAAAQSGSPTRATGTYSGPERRKAQAARGVSFGGSRSSMILAAALVAIAFGLGVTNLVGISPSDIKDLTSRSLSDTSPYLKSAYRNEDGFGGLLIGRLDAGFQALPLEVRIEAANEMVRDFEFEGVREAMLYDEQGLMQVHYSAGRLHRPRAGDRSTARTVGKGAARRSLSGEIIDSDEESSDPFEDISFEDENEDEIEEDDWADDDF